MGNVLRVFKRDVLRLLKAVYASSAQDGKEIRL